jgi:hypothetical protein
VLAEEIAVIEGRQQVERPLSHRLELVGQPLSEVHAAHDSTAWNL